MKNEVTPYGRWLFWVTSASRDGLRHLVDLEPDLLNDGTPDPKGMHYRCTCESFEFNVERPCRHVRAVVRFLRPIFAYFGSLAAPKKSTSYDTMAKKPKRYTLNPNKTLKR